MRGNRAPILLFLALGAVVLAPLTVISVPVMIDFPNHLARIWVQMDEAGRAAADAHYSFTWKLIPNLAIELLLPALARILPFEIAGRVFVGAAILMPALASLLLHRALHGPTEGPSRFWPLLALPFTYHAVLYWGFVNYLFGLGAALLLFWLWVARAHRPLAGRLALFGPLAALLFLLHLFAFGVYGLLVLGFELGRRGRPLPRALLAPVTLGALAQFLPAGALWVAAWRQGGPGLTLYGDVWAKIYALQAPMAFGALPGALAMALVVPALVALRRGALDIHGAMRLPLALTGLAALAMPSWVLGSWGADMRLPVALPFLFLAATRPRFSHHAQRLLLGLALIFLVLRAGGLALNWAALEREHAEFRAAAAQHMPRGTRLLPVLSPLPAERAAIPGLPFWFGGRTARDYHHIAALAIIDRNVFIPNLFTGWTLIKPAPRHAGRFVSQDDPIAPEHLHAGLDPSVQPPPNRLGEAPYWPDWPEKFDYVLWIDFAATVDVPTNLRLLHTGSFFRIYRVEAGRNR